MDILMLKLRHNKHGVYTERSTPPLFKDEARPHFLNMSMSRRGNKNYQKS
jgi:hypothetical protein